MDTKMSRMIDKVALALPVGVMLIPATMIYTNVQRRLGFGPVEGLAAGVFVEGMGFVTIATALEIYEQNQAEADPAQRRTGMFWIAAGGTLVYLAVVILLNVLMDDGPALNKAALALLSSLSPVAGLMIVLRKALAQRRAEMERRDEAERLAAQAQAAQERAAQERAAQEAAQERQARREMRLAEKRLEVELRVAENNKPTLPVTPRLAESSESLRASGGRPPRWSLLGEDDKRRVLAIVRECQLTNGEMWKKPAAVTVRVAFGLEERHSYKWLEYAVRDADALAAQAENAEVRVGGEA
jgi:hypothetical protein